MLREKGVNPLFISTTNGAYNFIDFTTEQGEQSGSSHQVEPTFKSQHVPLSRPFGQITEKSSVLFEAQQKTRQSTPKPITTESMMESKTSNFPFQKIQKSEYGLAQSQNTDSVTNFGNYPESHFSMNQTSPSVVGKTFANEYTEDKLLEFIMEPHRSNILALKSKSKNTQTFTGY